MTKKRALVFVETTGSIVWFAMDACWMLGARLAALVLAVPTVLLAILVFRFVPRRGVVWLVTGAMVAWACMNVLWMASDLKLAAWGLLAGKGFLVLGSLLIGAALVVGRTEALQTLFTRFRRLRLRA